MIYGTINDVRQPEDNTDTTKNQGSSWLGLYDEWRGAGKNLCRYDRWWFDHEIEMIFICQVTNAFLSDVPIHGIQQRKPGIVTTPFFKDSADEWDNDSGMKMQVSREEDIQEKDYLDTYFHPALKARPTTGPILHQIPVCTAWRADLKSQYLADRMNRYLPTLQPMRLVFPYGHTPHNKYRKWVRNCPGTKKSVS